MVEMAANWGGENLRICVSAETDRMIFFSVGEIGAKFHFFAKVVQREFVQKRLQDAWQLGLQAFYRL